MKGSHLRQVSSASLDTVSSRSTTRSIHHDNPHGNSSTHDFHKNTISLSHLPCSIWVHDESFSRDEVLFNVGAFSDLGVKTGDLIEVSATRNNQGEPTAAPKFDSASNNAWDGSDIDAPKATHQGSDDKLNFKSQGGYLFLAKPLSAEIKSRQPNLQISVTSSVANMFGFKNRSQVILSVKEPSQCSASHIELVFRDQYLLRADMWRLAMSELVGKPVYKGQKIMFLGSIKATVKSVYVGGNKVLSGYFSPHTIPVFRSESARYVLFIQMSREMWDFDSEGTGDILFSRVINGFLPEIFKRWAKIDARHLVTIVLFTRVQYDYTSPTSAFAALSTDNLNSRDLQTRSQDFYRVVVNDMPSGKWTTILNELKKEFRTFLRDVSIPQAYFPESPTKAEDVVHRDPEIPATIAGRPSTALQGNILEAINVASSYLSFEHIGRDLVRTGTSILVITPGTGVFEVDYDALAMTSELLTSRAIAIDLICLSPMPLHSAPLFRYRIPSNDKSRPVSKDSITHSSLDVHVSPVSPDSPTDRPSHIRSVTMPVKPISISQKVSKLDRNKEKSEQWGYGIPHWIDISFWNPRVHRDSRTAVNDVSKTPVPSTIARQAKLFIPRVRMYEIQMMGVMESEQSNISVPYLLNNDNTRPGRDMSPILRAQGSHEASSRPRPYLSPHGSSLRSHRSNGTRPGSLMFTMKDTKRGATQGPTKQLAKTMEWMDAYDNAIFQKIPDKSRPRKNHKSSGVKQGSTSSHISERRGSRLTTDTDKGLDKLARNNQTTHRESGDVPSTPRPPRSADPKPAKKSIMKSSVKMPAPRISRSISFALRGLGPAPPRAGASTEVNAEHASAQPTSSRHGPTESISEPTSVGISSATISDPMSSPSTTTPKSKGSDTATTLSSEELTPSRPISIRAAQKKKIEEGELGSQDNSLSTTNTELPHERDQSLKGSGIFPMKRIGPKFDLAHEASQNEPTMSLSPAKALRPWIIPVNPCNPPKSGPSRSSWFGRWQHVYPRMPSNSSVKWTSLKSPAILPLTTEEFPSRDELASDYLQTPYRVYQNDETDIQDVSKSREAILREMISLRLSHGFQIVVGKAVEETTGPFPPTSLSIFNIHSLSKDGVTIFMTLGNTIHRLVCVAGGGVEITKFSRKPFRGAVLDPNDFTTRYTPAVKTILSSQYCKNTITLQLPREEYNWNYADAYIAGHRDHLTDASKQLRFWRTRYVLIPVHLPANAGRPRQSYNEDNEEEIHLLGINHMTNIWQRFKYVSPEERRFQPPASKTKDQNPLNIMFQTSNPSDVVAAELDRLLVDDPGLDSPVQLLPDSELLERSNISLLSLAQAIQGEKGVRMMDRRWHWRLHYNCFVGLELTTWMLQNFRDIDTREEAVDFGNELMKHGLFHHVQRRHNFRDGNYFYQISDEYRLVRPESRSTWFSSRKPEKSTPNTPQTEGTKGSPSGRFDSSLGGGDSRTETPTPVKAGSRTKVSVYLSKSMKFDVDPRKRSNRPEVVDLHYDRLHNPDNCFHIEMSWLNATPKLVEDAVVTWATTAEKFGLKLVELPISEASSIVETQIFRRPYPVKMKINPPEEPPPSLFSATSFASRGATDRLYYHKALLKKFDFVLDFEARGDFPPDVDVSYSWGKPDFRYPQYVHRTGAVLAQVTDDGYFLFLTNRLYSGRVAKDPGKFDRNEAYRPRASTIDPLSSPHMSPIARPIAEPSQPPAENLSSYRLTNELKTEIEAFCNDTDKLERFFVEAGQAKPISTKLSPTMPLAMDSSIPTLELPTSLVGRNASTTPNLDPQKPSSSIDSVVNLHNRKSPFLDASRPSPSPRM